MSQRDYNLSSPHRGHVSTWVSREDATKHAARIVTDSVSVHSAASESEALSLLAFALHQLSQQVSLLAHKARKGGR